MKTNKKIDYDYYGIYYVSTPNYEILKFIVDYCKPFMVDTYRALCSAKNVITGYEETNNPTLKQYLDAVIHELDKRKLSAADILFYYTPEINNDDVENLDDDDRLAKN